MRILKRLFRGGDELKDIGLRKEISKMSMFENDQIAPVNPARQKALMDGSIMMPDKSLAPMYRQQKSKSQDNAIKKKSLTLLGAPPGFKDPTLSPTKGKSHSDDEDDLVKTKEKGEEGFEGENGDLSPVRPRYLAARKAPPFDSYFETLNIEIGENRDVIRRVYMAIGGLIAETDLFPEKGKNRANFALEDEVQNKINEIEVDSAEQEEIALRKKGLE